MIPARTILGHLPPGRFRVSLPEIEAEFVQHQDFGASQTRQVVWRGFLDYLEAWNTLQVMFDQRLLLGVWVGGSFASSVVDPADIDVSPIYDDEALRGLRGRQGVGGVRKLIGHRDAVREDFKVEPFPVPWRAVQSSLFPDNLAGPDQSALAARGGLDDWWQRVRPPGPKGPPQPSSGLGDRGYLEVLR